MFSCCRCGNPKTKDGKPSKKSKQKSKVGSEGEEEENNTTSPVPTSTSTSPPPDGQQNSSFSSFTSPLTSPGSPAEPEEVILVNGQVSSTTTTDHHNERLASPTENDDKEEQDNNLPAADINKSLSASSSPELEEDDVVGVGEPQEINQAKDITNGIEKTDGREEINIPVESANESPPEDIEDDNDDEDLPSPPLPPIPYNNGDIERERMELNYQSTVESSPSSNATFLSSVIENRGRNFSESSGNSFPSPPPLPLPPRVPECQLSSGSSSEVLPRSCLSRRSSSLKKSVYINHSAKVIEENDKSSWEDDEVFSDSITPNQRRRANMCAPFLSKRGSIHGSYGLPEWFNEERFVDIEADGSYEPPVTPIGRDELELKRHRLYSDLVNAAQAAVEHRVRFDPLGPDIEFEDCDPDIRPTITSDLEHLLNRLENLVERLERSLTAKELALANQTLDSVLETRRRSFDIESAELPPIPEPKPPQPITNSNSDSFSLRLERIENSLGRLNDSYKRESLSENQTHTDAEGSLENIPTVLEDFQVQEPEPIDTMSVLGYQDIVNGPFSQYLALSQKIGGDVAQHSEFVRKAFDAQLQQIILASQISTPPPNKQQEIIKPTADQISAIQEYREKHRASPFFNHLSAISESIPALGWVCVAPTPGPYVKEMNDAGQFYTNRVLKDWKEKDTVHVEWARSWIQTLTDLQQYIKQYHTTGLVWSGKGSAPAGGCPPPPPSAAGCPPPPPPPVLDMSALSFNDASNDDRSALFAEINKGADITKGLKKVTADMQTHKNPTLRTGPAPFVTPNHANNGTNSVGPAKPVKKDPVFNRDGKKWLIEYHENNPNLVVDNTEMNNVIYVFKCVNSTLTVKGKVNNVVFDSCKKCSLLFDSVVSSIEFVNCQSVQMQVLGKVPTISIDKTDGCQMYLSSDSLGVEIVSSKSSEMNVLIPKPNGEYTEQPIPEQFKTFIKGNNLQTICVESLG